MKHLIHSESRLNRLGLKVMDLFFLNLLFIFTSLPIITIGASQAALSAVTMKMAQDNLSFPFSTYFKEFKKNFLRGTSLFIVLLISFLTLFVSIRFANLFSAVPFVFMGIGLLIATIILIIEAIFIYSYHARYEDSLRNSFKAVLQVALLNPKETFGTLLFLISILVICSIDSFWIILFSFFMFVCGFSTLSLITAYMVRRMFIKYEKA